MPSRLFDPSAPLRAAGPAPRGGRKIALASAMGLALALTVSSLPAARAQALLPPGDLMRPQGQGASQTPPASPAQPPAAAPLPPQRPSAATSPTPPAAGAAQAAATRPSTAAAPTADGRASRATIDRVTTYYNSVQALSGNFTQIDPDGTRRTGDFYMQKPGRVRFEYDAPSPVELISNGQSVAVRDRKLNTQDITPLSQTPLRFLLAEHVDLGADPHVSGVFQDDTFVTVVMEEQVPMMGTYRLLILFDAKTAALKQWIVTDPQGYDTQVTLTNMQVNKRPDPKLFVINFERILQ